MLEREKNHMVFLYKKRHIEGSPTNVEWDIVRKLEFISSDICDISPYNFLFTPSLMYYLDFNIQLNKYTIKRSVDQIEVVELDPGYLSPDTDAPIELVKRFKWVTNTSFKVINYEGFEKIFDISEAIKLHGKKKPSKYYGINVVGQNRVPMIDFDLFKKEYLHFYEDMTTIRKSDSIEPRLIRKIQNY